jgi:hypothetical protein
MVVEMVLLAPLSKNVGGIGQSLITGVPSFSFPKLVKEGNGKSKGIVRSPASLEVSPSLLIAFEYIWCLESRNK